jgi:flavin-dependent dehydrogenase
MLVDEAVRIGVDIRTGASVADISFTSKPVVILESGERIQADVVVGADGKQAHQE